WLPRALAFEHRLVAAVADPGVMDVSTSWLGFLPPEMVALLRSGDKATFNGCLEQMGGDAATERTFAFRARPYGTDDPFDVFTGEKEILQFTAEQGANWHCEPMGRQLANRQMLDWLADRLPKRDL